MKRYKIIFTVVLFFAVYPTFSQQGQLIVNEQIGAAFSAGEDWHLTGSNSPGVLELENRNKNMDLRIWRENFNGKASECLDQVMAESGMICNNKPFEVKVDGYPGLAALAGCIEMRHPMKVMLIAIEHPGCYYMVRIMCPEECFRDHKGQLDNLINSIRIMNDPEGFRFYAKYYPIT